MNRRLFQPSWPDQPMRLSGLTYPSPQITHSAAERRAFREGVWLGVAIGIAGFSVGFAVVVWLLNRGAAA